MAKNTYKIDKKEQKQVNLTNRGAAIKPDFLSHDTMADKKRAMDAGLPVKTYSGRSEYNESQIEIAESHKRAVERSKAEPKPRSAFGD